MKFSDKVVFISGGSDGLGKCIAEQFLRAGARVAINGRNTQKLDGALADLHTKIGATEKNLIGIAGDIADSASVKAMYQKLLAAFGTLEILVNNAARVPGNETMGPRLTFMKTMTEPGPRPGLRATSGMSDADFEAMTQTNINGTFYMTREALKIMEPKRYGKIVNIASTAGTSIYSCHSPHYSASKAGMIGFSKAVAAEVIGDNINVNCIAPGGIATEAWNTVFAQMGEAMRQQVLSMIPSRRMGTVEEYASLALYLSSDEAAYLVGQVISPNGGMVI